MNGTEFIAIVDLFTYCLNQMFAVMQGVEIVSTSPPLTVYGFVVFVMFAVLTSDFVANLRSGN